MDVSLKGHLLPTNVDEFIGHLDEMKFKRCMRCSDVFGTTNTFTKLGWRETQISGFCERCFDRLFNEDGDE